jgi:hypothetical protein
MRHLAWFAVGAAAAWFTAPIGCSADGGKSSDDDDGNTSGVGGAAANAVGIGSGGNGSGGGGDCPESAKLIYVVGTGNELFSFSPPTNTFTPIGTISCPAGSATPFSMAVDRSGLAWVLFSDGNLFHVSTENAECTGTTFVPNQVSGFSTFGMGFVSDAAGSDAETLYVGAYGGQGIGRIDTTSLTLTQVGTYDLVTGPAEITGTGDGRLYGFFQASPDIVAAIDKTNSHILEQHYPTVDIGDAWAFAFWGGSFYLFTNPGLGSSSQVDRYDPGTMETETVEPSTGIRIVGAGVSTCAPVTPPS